LVLAVGREVPNTCSFLGVAHQHTLLPDAFSLS
jgi:hypothetical protein